MFLHVSRGSAYFNIACHRRKMLPNHKKHKSHKLGFCAFCGHLRETSRCRILQQAPNIVPYLCGLLGVRESINFKGVTLWPKS